MASPPPRVRDLVCDCLLRGLLHWRYIRYLADQSLHSSTVKVLPVRSAFWAGTTAGDGIATRTWRTGARPLIVYLDCLPSNCWATRIGALAQGPSTRGSVN